MVANKIGNRRVSKFLGVDDEDESAPQEGEGQKRPSFVEHPYGALQFSAVKTQPKSWSDELQHGAMRGDIKRVKASLAEGASPQTVNPRGLSPLMLASASNGKESLEVLSELLSKKADLAGRDHCGWTSLHHACRNGKIEIAKFLIMQNADPVLTTTDHKTTLMLAAIEGKLDLVKELLNNKTIRHQVPDKDATGATALHYAVKDGHLEIVKMLCDTNAKVGSRDIDGKQPLMYACEHGRLECVKLLVKKRADLEGKDKCQRTPLMYACLNGHENNALWLLKKSADVTTEDFQGETPFSVGEDMGMSEFRKAIKLNRQAQEEEAQ